MASIGSISFIRMTGPKIPQALPVVQTIDREGIDLSAFRIQAYKNAEITVRTVQSVSTAALANAAPNAYAALIGSTVTVVDDLDLTTTDVLVVDARVVRTQLLAASAPTGSAALVYGVFVLRPTLYS